MELFIKRALRLIGYMLPNYRPSNRLVAAPLFFMVHSRWPKNWMRIDAGINDFTFHRMIANEWSGLEIAMADKELAKDIAASLAGSLEVFTPPTRKVIKLRNMSFAQFELKIGPYLGQPLVAKPTHGSGTVVFLVAQDAAAQLSRLYKAASRNYFYANRETQYMKLEKKVIIEADISDEEGRAPNDYKFHCSRGHIIYCQHDIGRFKEHRRAILSVPSFGMMDQEVSFPRPDKVPPKPKTWDKMLEVASALSMRSDYVRIDLYEYQGKVFLGEFTLTPGAGMGDCYRDPLFEKYVLDEVKNRLVGPRHRRRSS